MLPSPPAGCALWLRHHCLLLASNAPLAFPPLLSSCSPRAGKPVTKNIFPFQYAFNLFSHNSPMTDNGYNEEEMKLVSRAVQRGAGGRSGVGSTG